MAQGILPFKYEEEKQTTGMTALAGLPLYLELAQKTGLTESIQHHIKVRESAQGWTDSQIVMSLILLNLAGGDCVDDLKVLEADDGFCEILKKAELHGLKRRQRRALLKRWRKNRTRTVPSASAVFRYLAQFHDAEQEKQRQVGKAFIPEANEHLRGFSLTNSELAALAHRQTRDKIATLDMDATLIETNKAEALYCYKGYRSYQPLNTWMRRTRGAVEEKEEGTRILTEFTTKEEGAEQSLAWGRSRPQGNEEVTPIPACKRNGKDPRGRTGGGRRDAGNVAAQATGLDSARRK